MAALNRPLFSEAVPLIRARFSPLCIKGTCGRKKISKIFRTRPEHSRTIALDWEMKEQLQFVKQVLNARLSDQTPTSQQHGRVAARVKALRPLRGAKHAALTQALPPAHFLRHVGNVQVWSPRDLKARDQDRGHRGHGRRRYGESFPVPVCDVGTEECCSPICCPACRFTSSHQVNTVPFSRLCADSCFRASSIADCRIVDTPTDSRSCSRSLVTTAISLRPRLAAT